eukprot:scaffold2235_cov167-Amphora_coffeaeformis.AAC.4
MDLSLAHILNILEEAALLTKETQEQAYNHTKAKKRLYYHAKRLIMDSSSTPCRHGSASVAGVAAYQASAEKPRSDLGLQGHGDFKSTPCFADRPLPERSVNTRQFVRFVLHSIFESLRCFEIPTASRDGLAASTLRGTVYHFVLILEKMSSMATIGIPALGTYLDSIWKTWDESSLRKMYRRQAMSLSLLGGLAKTRKTFKFTFQKREPRRKHAEKVFSNETTE